MLRRILDPSTSTRRTEAARQRLAEHPMTTALLDAGVRLLLAEFAPPAPAAGPETAAAGRETAAAATTGAPDVPARLFAGVTVARVCAAATRLGPLRATEGHLRDRWPLQADYLTDLLAYGLWELHWADVLDASSELVPGTPAAVPPGGIAELAAGLAELNLYSGRMAVTHRLELLMATMASSRPGVSARRRQSYAHLDASGGSTFAAMFHQVGMRQRPGYDHGELTVAYGALAEGANLRLVPRHDQPGARRLGLRTISEAGQVLALRYWAPVDELEDDGEHLAPWSEAPPPAPRLEDVLERITDRGRQVRRTEEGRRRLARDPITRQLLDGGLAVLAEDVEVAQRPGGSRIFDALSVAAVVEEARRGGGDGAGASVAQLRDRWVVQEHYVDDLVSHALRHRRSVVDTLGAAASEGGLLGEQAATAAVLEHLRTVQEGDAARLRLLVTTLASSRPGIAEQLVQLDDAEQSALTALLGTQLELRGWELHPGVDLRELAGWLLALSDGVEIRLLATGGAPDRVGDGSLAARTGFELVRGCCRPRTAGTA